MLNHLVEIVEAECFECSFGADGIADAAFHQFDSKSVGLFLSHSSSAPNMVSHPARPYRVPQPP